VNPEQLLVTVLPGLPTTAEFFLLPDKHLTEGKPDKTATHLDQVLDISLTVSDIMHDLHTLMPISIMKITCSVSETTLSSVLFFFFKYIFKDSG